VLRHGHSRAVCGHGLRGRPRSSRVAGGITSPYATLGAPVTAVTRAANKLDAFVVGMDERIYTAAWEPAFTDGWHGWWSMGAAGYPLAFKHQGSSSC
jgi:hypothetical protein